MEQNLPVIAKRVWGMVRVIFFMLRRGISKRKFMVDLNMMLKRGNKIASKAIGNLMFYHHNHNHNNHDPRHMPSFATQPCEYEFSCSNTPNYSLPFHLSKRSRHHHYNSSSLFSSCAFQAPPTHEEEVATMNAVKLALEMLNINNNNEIVEAPSPILPGFGRSPMVRQLRITDSPFPLRDVDDDDGFVDKKAEEFIQKFYKDLRKQKRMDY